MPEFNSGDRYPNDVIDYWITVGTALINADRWGATLAEVGIGQHAAHNVVLWRKAMDDEERGGAPGQSGMGIVNSKQVDKVSVGYDTAGGAELEAGHWNLTIYGRRYVQMAKMMGAGAIQVGVPSEQEIWSGAWPGPWTGLIPNPSG